MAITESKVKEGVLTLGTAPADIDFSCQVTNVRFDTSYDDDGDAQETLCGDTLTPGRKLSGRKLAGTVIQDFTAAESIIEYLWTNELQEVTYTFTPNADGPTATGTVLLEVPASSYGGDVNTRIFSDFEWNCVTEVLWTPPVAAMAAESA